MGKVEMGAYYGLLWVVNRIVNSRICNFNGQGILIGAGGAGFMKSTVLSVLTPFLNRGVMGVGGWVQPRHIVILISRRRNAPACGQVPPFEYRVSSVKVFPKNIYFSSLEFLQLSVGLAWGKKS